MVSVERLTVLQETLWADGPAWLCKRPSQRQRRTCLLGLLLPVGGAWAGVGQHRAPGLGCGGSGG